MVDGKCFDLFGFSSNVLLTLLANNTDNPVHLTQTAHAGVRASDFVGRTQGKLRDHYRIGKVLGTGT